MSESTAGPRSTVPPAASIGLWHSLAFQDAEAMMTWLGAVGFVEHATYRDPDDPHVVVHAEWLWPGGGGLMFGSLREGGSVDNVGRSSAYLVTDDPDGVHARAVAAGATSTGAPEDQSYGGRSGAVRDPEGNHWSIGSYQPS